MNCVRSLFDGSDGRDGLEHRDGVLYVGIETVPEDGICVGIVKAAQDHGAKKIVGPVPLPTEKQVVATTKSQFAKAAVTVDAENAQVRIVVTNQRGKDVDGETSHTYVLQYEKAEIEGTPYAGYLNIEMAGTPLAYNQAANIEIAETGEGVCTFMLPDFQFMDLSLGDIVVENVSIIEGEDGVKTYSGSTPEDGNLVLVPGAITASVSLTGTIDASGNCDFTIDVLWIERNLP